MERSSAHLLSGIARSDVASYLNKPAYGNSGFQLIASVASLSVGTHAVTVIAIDSGGRSTTLGPLSINITGAKPVGNLGNRRGCHDRFYNSFDSAFPVCRRLGWRSH